MNTLTRRSTAADALRAQDKEELYVMISKIEDIKLREAFLEVIKMMNGQMKGFGALANADAGFNILPEGQLSYSVGLTQDNVIRLRTFTHIQLFLQTVLVMPPTQLMNFSPVSADVPGAGITINAVGKDNLLGYLVICRPITTGAGSFTASFGVTTTAFPLSGYPFTATGLSYTQRYRGSAIDGADNTSAVFLTLPYQGKTIEYSGVAGDPIVYGDDTTTAVHMGYGEGTVVINGTNLNIAAYPITATSDVQKLFAAVMREDDPMGAFARELFKRVRNSLDNNVMSNGLFL